MKTTKRNTNKKQPKVLTGVLSVTEKGTGYLVVEGREEDIEIDVGDLNTALNKDTVTAEIVGKFSSGRVRGKVVEIVERAKDTFVGTLEHENERYFCVPDDRKFYKDIEISKESLQGAEVGEKIQVKIDLWDDPAKNPQGSVIKVIGKKGDNSVEMHAIVLEKGFDVEFPEEVLREAEAVKKTKGIISHEEITKRVDMRDVFTFTIDPADAKDFDDAISFKKLESGNFEIGIHIADVSYYVSPNSILDREAQQRQFSVYLADRTIPMLPQILSNDLCSLNPHEDKLVFSAVFLMDKNGQVHKRSFHRSIINSSQRYSYESAEDVLHNKNAEFHHELTTLNGIAKKLRAKNFANGAIDFEKNEIKIEVDDTGRPIRIYHKPHLDTHKLVEEFMLLANYEVAEFIFRNQKKSSHHDALIYRVHDTPNHEKTINLAVFLKAFGYYLKVGRRGEINSKDINTLIQCIRGTPEESLIKTAIMRSLAKAVYSIKNIGHFGLAFRYYTHFTSPIRRYPDLMIHRMLAACLAHTSTGIYDAQESARLCTKASTKEIAAASAERESIKLKQVEFMAVHVGGTFEGIISGVTEWGLFISEIDTEAEGMVRLRDLTDDFYIFDEKNYCVIGKRTKNKYTLGDVVKFKIVAASVERRTLDYQLV
jgi:ribonuclease R